MNISNRQKVVNILNDYYGEDRVDNQSPYILIYWPEVTITNENDRSIVIKELYAKIKVNTNGTLEGTFKLNRTEYSCTEWYNNYMHSHVSSINRYNPLHFSESCLGQGPIRDTMAYLNTNFDEELWAMFALELDKYVHTESLSGGPYHKMETLNRLPETRINEHTIAIERGSFYYNLTGVTELNNILWEFIPYVLEKRPFDFSFSERYYIADSDYNIVVKLSNLFIEWFNSINDDSKKQYIKDYMVSNEYLNKYKANGGILKRLKVENHDYSVYRRKNGIELWVFKGVLLHLNITGIPEQDEELPVLNDPFLSTLLNPEVALYITDKMLNVINYHYARTETYTRPDKKTYYLSTYNPNRGRTEDSASVF